MQVGLSVKESHATDKSICSLKTCNGVFVTYDDVETSQILGGKFPICWRTQASWWKLERLRLAVM